MTNDLQTTIDALNARFSRPPKNAFYDRRIIFWNDPEAEFADRIDEIQLENAKIVKLTGRNFFSLRHLIEIDEPKTNLLIYVPFSYPNKEANWLRDVEIYSEQFRADLSTNWLPEMKLPTSPEIWQTVKKYWAFFKKEPHRRKFSEKNHGVETTTQIEQTIMAVLCDTRPRPNNLLRSVLSRPGNLDILAKYKIDASFWLMAALGTGYNSEKPDPKELCTHILLTALSRTLSKDDLRGLERFISLPHQAFCADFVMEWLHCDEKDTLLILAEEVEFTIRLKERFQKIQPESLLSTEVFPGVNESILIQLMNQINSDQINPEEIKEIVTKRRTMAWFDKTADYFEGVLLVAKMYEFCQEHSTFHEVNPTKLWNEYTDDLYRMDTFYREFQLHFNKMCGAGGILEDLFKQIADKVENIYTHNFLEPLATCWTTACADNLRTIGRACGTCPPTRQLDFYDNCIQRSDSRVFVIISDAFRYETAVQLVEILRLKTQSSVELTNREALFPTVTKFGMAALLPHKKLEIKENANGVAVLSDGQSTEASNRDQVLKNANPKSTALTFKQIMDLKSADRKALVKGMEVVYIYHNQIDDAGHAGTGIFEACEKTFEEMERLVRLIANEFGGTRIFITADHGFLYTRQTIREESKISQDVPPEETVEIDRRYILTKGETVPEFLLPVRLLDGQGDLKVYTPSANVCIRRQGMTSGFLHGGITLQEMVIPVINVHYLRNSSKEYQRHRDQYDTKPVTIELFASSRKIHNLYFSLDFYQCEAAGGNMEPTTYELFFEDSAGQQVSDTQKIIADDTNPNKQERVKHITFVLQTMKYSSTEPYYLVIRDEKGLQIPQRLEFQFSIACTGNYHFFQ